MDIPSDIQSSAFSMVPETDDLIFGIDIHEGMIVLAEDPNSRSFINLTAHSIHKDLTEAYQQMALRKNRWMKVGRLWDDRTNSAFRFIGEFSDGLKTSVYAEYGSGWYVKKDSVAKIKPWSEFCDDCLDGGNPATCGHEGCKNFKPDNLEITYNVSAYQGRQCTRCRWGHIYNEICSTPGCTQSEVHDHINALRAELSVIVGGAMDDSKLEDDPVKWTGLRGRAVKAIMRAIQNRKALLHSEYVSINREPFSLEELRERLGASFRELLTSKHIFAPEKCTNKILETILKDFDVYEKETKCVLVNGGITCLTHNQDSDICKNSSERG